MSTSIELTDRLPIWLRERLDSCPAAGDGLHFWIFSIARHLLAHFDETTTCELLFDAARRSGRPLRTLEREIASQVRNAFPGRWQPRNPETFTPAGTPTLDETPSSHFTPSIPGWPLADEDLIRRIVANDFGLVALFDQSPIRFEDEHSHTEEIIDVLFPGDPLLCVGKSSYQFATRRREVWRGRLGGLPLIVPSPMTDVLGQTANGDLSEHTKEQTSRRVYLVIEFDFAEFGRDGQTPSRWASLVREWRAQDITVADACAALLLHLAQSLPLVCAVHSGGKSLHGWYRAFDRSKRDLRHFMAYAISAGADRATWTRSQFVRIPDGLRENGKRQSCYYLDPQEAAKS